MSMTPDEMAATIRLPKHLDQHPWLFPAYVDNEYNVRGIYRGVVGWFAEDTADLHFPSARELGEVIIEGFGGKGYSVRTPDELSAALKQALDDSMPSIINVHIDPQARAKPQKHPWLTA